MQEQGEGCQISLLQVLPPPAFKQFAECQRTRTQNVDNGIVGSALDIGARCWCDHKVKESIDALGCCQHPDFKNLCELQCEPDCASQEAQICLEKCPPICLEPSLAPPLCEEGCSSGQCHRYLLCITEHSKNQTKAGTLEKTCDEKAFMESQQVANYVECGAGYPRRTYWQRKNWQMHCSCKEGLAKAAEQSKCCNALWAEGICDTKCAAPADCTTANAQGCLKQCRDQCTFQGADVVVTECYKTCLSANSTCHLYATCEPLEQLSFDYVCDDGESPSANGCCAVPYMRSDGQPVVVQECATLCDSRQVHQLPHGNECLCEGCPKSVAEMRTKFEAVLEKALWVNGQEILVEVSHLAELKRGATPEMQRLMAERNEKLLEAFMTSKSNAEGEARMMQINEEYLNLIVDAAKAAQDPDATLTAAIASGDKQEIAEALRLTEGAGASPSLEAEAEAKLDETKKKEEKEAVKEKEKDTEGSVGIGAVIGIIAGVVIFMSVAFAFVWTRSKKTQNFPSNFQANSTPANGPTIVVGQPVNPAQATTGAPVEGAVQGAPMASSKDGEKPV